MYFTSRAHLINQIREEFDRGAVLEFAKRVLDHPLTKTQVKLKGSVDEILNSLVHAPKAVLELVYDELVESEISDESDDDWYDEDSDEDDEVDEEDEADDEDE